MAAYEQSKDATVYAIPLSKKKIVKKTIAGVVQSLLIIVVLSVLISMWIYLSSGDYTSLADTIIYIMIALLIVVIIGLIFYNDLYNKNYYYDIRKNEIVIRKGIVIKKELSITYDKVEEVYIDQDLLDKILGIYDVHLMTAAEHSQDFAHIDGLDEENAKKIKEMIVANVRNASSK